MANFVYYLGVRIIRIAGRRINDAMRVNRVYTSNDTELETGFGSEDTQMTFSPDDNDDDTIITLFGTDIDVNIDVNIS
jgi:hypothetical protein